MRNLIIKIVLILFAVFGIIYIGYLTFHEDKKRFSYLENKNEITQLAAAFTLIESKSMIVSKNSEVTLRSLEKPEYESFLDKTNPYHVLLSYYIGAQLQDSKDKIN